jgi:hypothetical protein
MTILNWRFYASRWLDTRARRAENSWVVRCAVIAVLVGAVACRGGGGDAAPPCGAVAARFVDIARYELASAKVDEATARTVADQLPAMRDSLDRACTEGRWAAATRKCLVQASDHAGFETCERLLTDEQRRDLDRATRGVAETP